MRSRIRLSCCCHLVAIAALITHASCLDSERTRSRGSSSRGYYDADDHGVSHVSLAGVVPDSQENILLHIFIASRPDPPGPGKRRQTKPDDGGPNPPTVVRGFFYAELTTGYKLGGWGAVSQPKSMRAWRCAQGGHGRGGGGCLVP
jgi:hypothetical protein